MESSGSLYSLLFEARYRITFDFGQTQAFLDYLKLQSIPSPSQVSWRGGGEMLILSGPGFGVPCWHSMLQVKVESEAGPFGQIPKRFHLDGRQVEIAENTDRWYGAGYCYFKVKGGDGNLYILRLDEGSAEWELTMFQTPQAEAFVPRTTSEKAV